MTDTAIMQIPPIYRSPAGEQAVMRLYDDTLAQWPLPYETCNFPTRHGDTFALTCGAPSAPPLILLHGAGTNATMWIADVMVYTQHFRVYAVDLPGEPGRSTQHRPDWEGLAFAEWLSDVYDALGIEGEASLVGISQGSWTALRFATTYPERVKKMALMCPGGIVPDRTDYFLRVMVYSLLGKWGMKRILRELYGQEPIPEGLEAVMAVVMKQFKSRMGVLPIFSDEELARLTMPVYLVGGSDDPMRDHEQISARLREHLPNLRVTIKPGGGHALVNTVEDIAAFLVE